MSSTTSKPEILTTKKSKHNNIDKISQVDNNRIDSSAWDYNPQLNSSSIVPKMCATYFDEFSYNILHFTNNCEV